VPWPRTKVKRYKTFPRWVGWHCSITTSRDDRWNPRAQLDLDDGDRARTRLGGAHPARVLLRPQTPEPYHEQV
jgi:hypothetical protein